MAMPMCSTRLSCANQNRILFTLLSCIFTRNPILIPTKTKTKNVKPETRKWCHRFLSLLIDQSTLSCIRFICANHWFIHLHSEYSFASHTQRNSHEIQWGVSRVLQREAATELDMSDAGKVRHEMFCTGIQIESSHTRWSRLNENVMEINWLLLCERQWEHSSLKSEMNDDNWQKNEKKKKHQRLSQHSMTYCSMTTFNASRIIYTYKLQLTLIMIHKHIQTQTLTDRIQRQREWCVVQLSVSLSHTVMHRSTEPFVFCFFSFFERKQKNSLIFWMFCVYVSSDTVRWTTFKIKCKTTTAAATSDA